MSLIATAIATLCYGIFRFIIWRMDRRRFYDLASKFQGPPCLPFIGNAHQVAGGSDHLLSTLLELNNSYSSPYALWVGPRLLLFATDPEHVKTVCLSPKTLEKGSEMDFGKPLLGEGILTAPAAKWKVHRRLIQPSFNIGILNVFVQIFAAQSEILISQIETHAGGKEFEIFNLVSACTLDMVCETTMGVKVGAQMKRNWEYVEAVQKIFAGFCKRIFSPWLYPDFIFYRGKFGRDEQKYVRVLHGFTDNVIEMRKNETLRGQIRADTADSENYECESKSRHEVLLDDLMKLRYSNASGFSDESIREEVIGVVIAGNDTTAVTSSFLMLMLASHPEVQERVYQEIYDIYGDDESQARPVQPKDLLSMKYLERVIKETMRLFPPVPLITKALTGNLDIDGDRTLPDGGSIVIGIIHLHRDAKYWTDPLTFNPDRFLPDEISKRHPHTFMPFGGGPRTCIGQHYGMMAIKTLVATVLRKYILKVDNIVSVKDIRLKMEILLKPVDPFKIRIEKRTGN